MEPIKTEPQHDELPALDAFEQQWVDQLNRRDPELARSEEAFVQSVLQQHAAPSQANGIVGRIGWGAVPYAAAAALVLAAFAGWFVLTRYTQQPAQAPVVQAPSTTPQPQGPSAVTSVERPAVDLGKLIAKARTTATNPATELTTTVSEVPEALNINRLFDVLGQSVPNLKEILAPLQQSNEQSRA